MISIPVILFAIYLLIAFSAGGLLALLLKLPPQQWTEQEKPMKFIQVIEKIGEDIKDVVEFPFTYGGKIVALIKSGQADEPALVAAFDALFASGEQLGADVGMELAAGGANFPDYLAAAKDAMAFGAVFKNTFLPAVEKTIGDIKTDIQPAAVVAAPAPGAAAPAPDPAPAATTGPGLAASVAP